MRYFLVAFFLVLVACEKDNGPYIKPDYIGPPSIQTIHAVWAITDSSAVCGGAALNDNGAPITEYGLVWHKDGDTTTFGKKIVYGNGGDFSDTMKFLQSKTSYLVAAYAINAYGTRLGGYWPFTTK